MTFHQYVSGKNGVYNFEISSLPEKQHDNYQETASGKNMPVTSGLKMLDGTEATVEDIPDNRFKARYVRVYSNGRADQNSENHFVEIKVNGYRGSQQLSDAESPTGPYRMKMTGTGETTAELFFVPANDNMGIAGYDITLVPKNETEALCTLEDVKAYRHTFDNLVVDNTYVITVKATDIYGNEGEPVTLEYTHVYIPEVMVTFHWGEGFVEIPVIIGGTVTPPKAPEREGLYSYP